MIKKRYSFDEHEVLTFDHGIVLRKVSFAMRTIQLSRCSNKFFVI